MKLSQFKQALWSHPQLVGYVEVGEVLDPVITRDEFKNTPERTAVYQEVGLVFDHSCPMWLSDCRSGTPGEPSAGTRGGKTARSYHDEARGSAKPCTRQHHSRGQSLTESGCVRRWFSHGNSLHNGATQRSFWHLIVTFEPSCAVREQWKPIEAEETYSESQHPFCQHAGC